MGDERLCWLAATALSQMYRSKEVSPTEDSAAWARMKAAGAILIGARLLEPGLTLTTRPPACPSVPLTSAA